LGCWAFLGICSRLAPGGAVTAKLVQTVAHLGALMYPLRAWRPCRREAGTNDEVP
jgi:hypothetical protein